MRCFARLADVMLTRQIADVLGKAGGWDCEGRHGGSPFLVIQIHARTAGFGVDIPFPYG